MGQGDKKQGEPVRDQAAPREVDSKTEALHIKTDLGEQLLQVELALTRAQHSRGLMFRRFMPASHGMLFIYESEQPVAMWMKNTILPLDMLFLKGDGTIVTIARNAEPFSKKIIPSGEAVLAVLELNAGTVDRLAIKVGDQLRHRLLKR